MLNVIVFGAPGSGKGTQSELIIKEFGLEHISTGELLRAEIRQQTALGKVAGEYIGKGHLVPDELIIAMLSGLLNARANSKGVIFDGFPRTIPQAGALKSLLAERNTVISAMLDLEVEEEELTNRLLERGKNMGRADDNPETIKARLDEYRLKTAPLVEYYKKEKVYHAIKGTGRIEEIFEQIKTILSRCRIS
jgi:adenylate kinase